MKAKLLIVAVIMIGVGIAACKKDQYTTKPQLSFKSVNGTTFNAGDFVEMKVEVTDKEGDIQDTLWIQKISTSACPDGNLVTPYKVPDYPTQSHLKAELDLNFIVDEPSTSTHTNLQNGCPQNGGSQGRLNDTTYFKLWIRDAAKNTSDTISTPKIILIGKK